MLNYSILQRQKGENICKTAMIPPFLIKKRRWFELFENSISVKRNLIVGNTDLEYFPLVETTCNVNITVVFGLFVCTQRKRERLVDPSVV